MVAVVLSVQLAQRIDRVEGVGLVEILILCDGDPLVELIEFGVVKVLRFCAAVGIYSVSGGWLSE